MSASPAKGQSGQPHANGAAAPLPTRKKAAVNIFNPKKKQIRKPQPANAYTGSGQVPHNAVRPQPPQPAAHSAPAAPLEDDPSTYQEFPIVIEKSALLCGLHYHGFRMQSRMEDNGKLMQVDPYNESEFTRPVRLYRRRPQDKPETADQLAAVPGEDDKEREMREAKRAERTAEREANQALIAPGGDAGKKSQQKKKPQKKVEDVYYDESNPKFQARSQLRYEEARPWHLEDFDNKNRWVGSYEEPLSKKHVMFEVSSNGFNLVPVEKWYRMVRTDKVKALDDRQIEKMMDSKHKAPRWFRSDKEVEDAARKAAIAEKREGHSGMRRAKQQMDDDDGPGIVKDEEAFQGERDEIDFEYDDEFQDDDEGKAYADQNDDDAKDIERRIREEMRGANLPDAGVKGADDQDWINEEKEERDKAEDERKRQKKLKKTLKRKEERVEYESDDSEGNLYRSSDSDDSEEEERERLEEEKKAEELKAKLANGDKSGASSKGTNTPNGRPEKKMLKRDADISDMSGNESSRKKTKLNGGGVKGARQLAPDAAAKRIPSGYGSGSDTDTSRAGRSKIKLKNSPPGSPVERNTPSGSRRGSPTGSRAQSPSRPQAPVFPALEEVKQAIPKEGVAVGDLVKIFKSRLSGRTTDFIALVKQAGKQDNVTKKIVPKVDNVD
ncbi:transcription factor IIF subunit tfg1 [Elasticomyces elasticus]|nr:transcription factor IIF subunit tfg1 [Elasticomyces elasticus]KAK3657480.1 transcription factor IIF subunit tfg1 [Elasticomyces elasticus]KAK4925653.1 transcription factor IIF subunit tfg1 [Elasticomyces elasticus]KAK5764985.1 transcription factor IIF subunit tfg1 [Elasticomyces elasticus]